MKKILIIGLFFISLILTSRVSAKSGCCSGHGGVNCGAGSQGNGKVICSDGWRGSSCLYSEMVMCGGNSQPAVKVEPVQSTQPTIISPTLKPTSIPTTKPTIKPSPKVIQPAVSCSGTADKVCPQSCTAGNDSDCCGKVTGYHWYENWGCYPEPACSAKNDGICSATCTAGNDADCCETKLKNYQWYEGRGCYPQEVACSATSDGICPRHCTAGDDADCCVSQLKNYQWYENQGCYPIE